MIVFNTSTSYFQKKEKFYYSKDYLMTKLALG
jgi:hypothetical protein